MHTKASRHACTERAPGRVGGRWGLGRGTVGGKGPALHQGCWFEVEAGHPCSEDSRVRGSWVASALQALQGGRGDEGGW